MRPARIKVAAVVVAALVALAAGVVATATPAAADRFGTWTSVAPALGRDGSDRIYAAWVQHAYLTGSGLEPDKLLVTRSLPSGARDTSFGTEGMVETVLEVPAPGPDAGGCAVERQPIPVISISPASEIVLGWYRNTKRSDGACDSQPVVDRYAATGARLSRTVLPGGHWAPSYTDTLPGPGTADGRLPLAPEDESAIQLVTGTGTVDGSFAHSPAMETNLSHVPGGPAYLTHRTGSEVRVQRLASGSVGPLDTTTTCPGPVRILPGTGSAYAVACRVADGAPAEVQVTYHGSTTWTRTIDDRLRGVTGGYVTDDGRVVVAGPGCDSMGCDFHGLAVRLGATGAADQVELWDSDGPSQIVPAGDDRFAWTGYFDTYTDMSWVDAFYGHLASSTTSPPAAPTAPTATAGDRQVSLSWSAPADGGSAITGYRITPIRDGVAQTPITVGNVTSRVITGLVNGAGYRFRVAAINDVGTGPYSALSATVVPGASPGAPTDVRATTEGRQARVTWSPPPAVPGMPVTGYRVTVIADGVPLQTITVGNVTTLVVPDLSPDVLYTFRVSAVNGAGTGTSSASSNVVTPPPAAFGSWPQSVDVVHEDLLGRDPTTPELWTWVAKLQSGTATTGDMVAALRVSPDNTTNVDPVTRLYQAYFLRGPDPGGLAYWVDQSRSGRSLRSTSAFFARSAEFTRLYGSLTNRQFVEQLYSNVLGRPGERSGTDFWTAELDSGRRSRGTVMIGFSESAEYKRTQASEVDVSVLYILLLGRAPTPTELAADVADLDGGASTASLAQRIIGSAEYVEHVQEGS